MKEAIFSALWLLACGAAEAQTAAPRIYVGAATGVEMGTRGPVFGGAVVTTGGLFAVNITSRWSAEVELDRGFRRWSASSEVPWISDAPQGASREEIERRAVRARFDRTQRAGMGVSAHLVFRTREPGRVNLGVLMGMSSRRYTSRVVRTIASVPPEWNLSPPISDDSTREMVGTGITAGASVLLQVTPDVTVAPELRVTIGIITDDPYRVLRPGVRVTWEF